jgi:hypothetical protein
MRKVKVDLKAYWNHEAREARRGLVQRRGISRFNGSGGEADMATETEVEQRRLEAQGARDERANRAALTKYVPLADELAKVRDGDTDAGRRLARFANHSPNAQAESLCARMGFDDDNTVEIENRQRLEEEADQFRRQEEAKRWARISGEPAQNEHVDDDVTRALRELKKEPRFFHDPRK